MKAIFPCKVCFESEDGRSLMIESNVTFQIGWVFKDDVSLTKEGLQTMVTMEYNTALEKGLIRDGEA